INIYNSKNGNIYLKRIIIDDPVYSLAKLEEFVSDNDHMAFMKKLKNLFILDSTATQSEELIIKNQLHCNRIHSDQIMNAIKTQKSV
ncbi:MAG: hypothetical protein WCT13_06325, partial [Patescibacteria group bacterium]